MPACADAGRKPTGLLHLLRPRWLSLLNTWRVASRSSRFVYVLFAALGLIFWLGLLWGLTYVVGGFYRVEVFGPMLTRRLLEILLLSLFLLLLFSNVVTSLSTFYLSRDLELVLALPVDRARFHYSRLLETLLQSSWMMAMFGLPLFVAYGFAYQAGATYWLLLPVVILAYLIIPASVGALVASLLVSVFPARRTREVMALVGLILLVAVFMLLRLVRPERFMDAGGFDSLASYVAEIQAPMPALLPPAWASEVILASLRGLTVPWEPLALLLVGAVALTALCRWGTAGLYAGGWARSQEAPAPRGAGRPWFAALTRVAEALVPASMRPLVVKDIRVFFRDPAQWSQLFLLASLLVIYLFSIQAIPMDQFRGPWAVAIRRSLAFLNLGLAGFVMAGIASRFQFSAVSTEGRAWWVVRSAPVDPRVFLRAKSLPGLVPMIVVGEILAVVSSLLLEAGVFLTVLSGLTALGMAWAMSGIAVSMGAIYPNFKADSAARVATGPPGMLYMVVALLFTAVLLLFLALPVYLWLRASALGVPLTHIELLGVVAPMVLAGALCVAAGAWPVKRAAHILWAREH